VSLSAADAVCRDKPTTSYLSPRHTIFHSHSHKIPVNITFPSMLACSQSSLPFTFPNQNPVYISVHYTCYMPHESHRRWPDDPNNIWKALPITKLLIMQFSPVSHHFLPIRPSLFSSAPPPVAQFVPRSSSDIQTSPTQKTVTRCTATLDTRPDLPTHTNSKALASLRTDWRAPEWRHETLVV
jgi:hypothetical protein